MTGVAGHLTKLANAGVSLARPNRRRRLQRWAVRALVAVVALIVLWELLLVAVRILATHLWFSSVRHGAVYTTTVEAQILLFAVFGVIAGASGFLTVRALHRTRRPLPFTMDDDTVRWTFRRFEPKLRRLIVVAAVVVPGVLVGQRAAAGWQTYLLWRDATPWHATDPLFHKDISFFVEVFPFHRMVVALLIQTVTYDLLIAVIGGYWYGGWRLRRGSRKVTRSFTRLVSALLAAYFVLEAAGVWVSRYALTTSPRGPVTGAGYTDTTAGLPSKYVLTVIALLGAIALIVNAARSSRVRWTVGTVAVVAVLATLIGSVWPSLVFTFRESPSVAKVDLGEIAHNQQATRTAFGLDGDVTTVSYDPTKSGSVASQTALASTSAQVSVIDPNQLSPTFNVEQQLQAYYGFKGTLDNGHYPIEGRSQDVVIATRELNSGAIPHPSWLKTHLVYTHGYGVVAAPTTKVNPRTQSPVFYNGGMPPAQQIPVTRPQVYFGQGFGPASYAIVGRPAGGTRNLEFDHPGSDGSSASAYTTYSGHGGIRVGSIGRRLLFALQLHDPDILFSSELNSASQLLTVRNPRARVAKLAPWLTLDGDVYPAVVNGAIKWIVDGYTTSSTYPDAQLVNLHSATETTLTARGASVAQPNTSVNYLQNSVKAVVDAYTGQVSLYEWNQSAHPDPLLKTWESVFPGLVQPQSDIPSALLGQLRYPTDLFNVQRSLLARYHVSEPVDFYSGNDSWAVPTNPTAGSIPLSSKYASMSADGFGAQHYSLSSPMVTLNGRQLAAFVYVNSEPGPDYGKFTVLQFPSGSGGEAPSQVQNDIESDTTITEALTLQRGGNSRVVLGDLQAIPVAGRILYVEPVYTQSSGGASFPILRHVIALYGNGDPSFETSVQPAIRQAIRLAAGAG